jgi:hypothetical protein
MRILVLAALVLISANTCWVEIASAQEHGRIKRPPPTAAEAERIASELVMNDGTLRKGDIVVTDRGFMMFLGVAADGYTFQFSKLASPVGLSGGAR